MVILSQQVLQDARVKVTASGYIPGQAFPTEKSELEGIWNCENNLQVVLFLPLGNLK